MKRKHDYKLLKHRHMCFPLWILNTSRFSANETFHLSLLLGGLVQKTANSFIIKFIYFPEFSFILLSFFFFFSFHLLSLLGFPLGYDIKESAWNAGDPDSIPGSGRSPGEGNGYLLQYSHLKKPMDRGAWWVTAHGPQRFRHNWMTNMSLQLFI